MALGVGAGALVFLAKKETCSEPFSAVSVAGAERVLHSFNYWDGGTPYSGLIDVNGVLYGTTLNGGGGGNGTVFTVTTAGTERVFLNFRYYGTCAIEGGYGIAPVAGLIEVNGVLYGTTSDYGAGDCPTYLAGTVFAVTLTGTPRLVYNFANGTDGGGPNGGLLDVNGVLYGTTSTGGTNGAGTVFAMTTTGTKRVLRNFGFCVDPVAPLIDVGGVLYGTTKYGGIHNAGTIFFVSP